MLSLINKTIHIARIVINSKLYKTYNFIIVNKFESLFITSILQKLKRGVERNDCKTTNFNIKNIILKWDL